MRIISGKFKNKKIFFPKNFKTRPLRDSVKENIFNILEHSKKIDLNVYNSNVLDLYAGSGSFGLETISRYKAKVTFVEKDLDALVNLKKNLKVLKIQNEVYLYEMDIFDFLDKQNFTKKFDIIFFDPPYSDDNFIDAIKTIKQKKILKENHIIILHRDRESKDYINNKLSIFESRKYGRSLIIFGKLNNVYRK